MMDFLNAHLGHFNYWIVIILMMTGFYTVISRNNLIKKLIGLNIFQTSVFLLFITMERWRVERRRFSMIPSRSTRIHFPTS